MYKRYLRIFHFLLIQRFLVVFKARGGEKVSVLVTSSSPKVRTGRRPPLALSQCQPIDGSIDTEPRDEYNNKPFAKIYRMINKAIEEANAKVWC
jgi:hypothetical protein